MKADPTGCTDTRCTHEQHCATAHYRLAHTLVRFVDRQKMDAPLLVRGICSCGNYRTAVRTQPQARIAHGHHQSAKLEALAKTWLPCVDCPPQILDAVFRRRAAAQARAAEAEAAGQP